MNKHTHRTQIRLPEDLYDALKASAEKRGRSINAEMIDRLNYSFTGNIDADLQHSTDDIINTLNHLKYEIELLKQKIK